jgi:DASS family divalent anion:Na+ symporter
MRSDDAESWNDVEALLRAVPFFAELERVEIARLIGALEPVEVASGGLIFDEGEAADGLYLLTDGGVGVSVRAADGERRLVDLEAPAYLGELGLLLARRTGSARAIGKVTLWKLPRDRFEQLVREDLSIGRGIATALADLIDRRSREHVGAPPPEAREPAYFSSQSPRQRYGRRGVIGIVLALALPAVLWWLPAPGALSPSAWHILLILLGTALAWLFSSVPDFIVALAMAGAWGIAALVPLDLVLSGFRSSAWVVAIGSFALAAAMARSGLLFRIGLILVKAFPARHVGQVLGLLVGGALVTPLVPLGLARVATASSLAQELTQTLGYHARTRASAALGFAALVGYCSFSSVMLSGLAMNFFVLDLLPAGERAYFGWLNWLVAAAPAGIVLLAGSAVAILAVFPAGPSPRAAAGVVRRQERALGPLSSREITTLAGLAVLLLGLLAQPWLHTDAAWIAMATTVVLVVGRAIDVQDFRSRIDWGFVMLFGILLGLAGVLRSVGLDAVLGAQLAAVAQGIRDETGIVVVVALAVVAVRLVLPWVPTTLLLSAALVPAAERIGISPWVVGFVILFVAQAWIVPSLYEAYVLAKTTTRAELFTDRQAITLGVVMTLLTLTAVGVSIVYWRAIGLL